MTTQTGLAQCVRKKFVRMVAICLAAGMATMDGYGAEGKAESAEFLKREVKYVPVAEFLPLAAKALARHHGVEPVKPAANKDGKKAKTEAFLVGDTLIVVDPQLNNVVVSGTPEALKIVDVLLDEIDVRPRQVYIQAVIAEVDLGREIQEGIDVLRAAETVGFKGKKLAVGELLRGAAGGPSIIDPGAIGEGEFRYTAGSKEPTFLDAYTEALESTGKFTVLSRPFVFTANNQTAQIASGERIGIPAERRGLFGSRKKERENEKDSAVSFEEVLFKLSLKPLINSKDEITLAVGFRNEELVDRKSLKNGKPNIAVTELKTTVRVPDKGIVVIGGIARPGKKELLMFFQPRVVAGAVGG